MPPKPTKAKARERARRGAICLSKLKVFMDGQKISLYRFVIDDDIVDIDVRDMKALAREYNTLLADRIKFDSASRIDRITWPKLGAKK